MLLSDTAKCWGSWTRLSGFPGESYLRHDQIYAKDPFGAFDVVDMFSSALPNFIESTSPEIARDTIDKILAEDGLLRGIDEHLKTSISPQVSQTTRQHMSMTCLKLIEKVFTYLEGFSSVRWYEFGVDVIFRSANEIVSNWNITSRPSAIHAYCALGLVNHVIISQFHVRAALGHHDLPAVHNLEEHLFILKVHDGILLGDENQRKQQQARRPGKLDTKIASSPRYLKSLLLGGPLQNFSTMASRLIPHLKHEEAVLEDAWMILHKLEVTGLADTTDRIALKYFGMVRASAQKEVVKKEGRETQKQLELLRMVNTIAEWLRLPELPMPELLIPPGSDLDSPIPPRRNAYSPVYI
jgi:hypothetical protein